MPDRLPVTILIQGGIASGKSTIARLLEQRGAVRLDCDRAAHEVLNSPAVQAKVQEAFGAELVRDGQVDRAALAAIVFEDPAALAKLEGWVHPGVRDRVQRTIDELLAAPGARPVVIVDAAVAEKMQLVADYDLRLFVKTPLALRQRRARERGWDEGELERREATQEPLAVREGRADYVLPNEGGLSEAEEHVERFWDDLVEPLRQEEERQERVAHP
ncbi:MAG: dephospho-CoA kinase [Planctomycetota bacterium]